MPVDLTALSAEEKEKRIKAVKKKLKAVDEVKSKRDSGTKLDAGQVSESSLFVFSILKGSAVQCSVVS